MATAPMNTAAKVAKLRKMAEDKSLPQDVRNTYLDEAVKLEEKAAKGAGVKMAKGGAVKAPAKAAPKKMAMGGAVQMTPAEQMAKISQMAQASPMQAGPMQQAQRASPSQKPGATFNPRLAPKQVRHPMAMRGPRTATNKAKNMMGGGYAAPMKTAMAKGGSVKKGKK